MKKIFIFGAGASVGSQENQRVIKEYQLAPVLNRLFDKNYLTHFSALGVYVTEIGNINKKILENETGLEDLLTDKWNEITSFNTPKYKDTWIKFFGVLTIYIYRLFQSVSESYDANNRYNEFLKKIGDNDFGIINFNYDTLLDQAMLNHNYLRACNDINDYIEADYIKPHGSVNWFIERRDSDPSINNTSKNDISNILHLVTSNMYRDESIPVGSNGVIVIPPTNDNLKEFNVYKNELNFLNQYGYPLVLAPITTKLYSHFDGFENIIMQSAKKLLSLGKEIYLIGYRASDSIIDEMFAVFNKGTVIHIINNNKEEAEGIGLRILNKWKDKITLGKIYFDGFSNFIQNEKF